MGPKERLIKFITYKCLTNKSFEATCGLGNGFVSKVGDSIRRDSLEKISTAFPELNLDWVINEKGDMLLGEKSAQPKAADFANSEVSTTVLLLPMYAQGGSLNDFVASAKGNDCEKVISPIVGVDFAIQVSGESMAPEYPNGSRIFIKKINEKAFIEWGKTYVLDTCNGTVVKRIVPSEKDGCIKCLSINPDPVYAPFDVSLSDVFGIYKVLLCMSVK